MTARKSPEQKLVASASAEIIAGGWPAFSLAKAARKAGIPLATAYEICPGKPAILALIGKQADLGLIRSAPAVDPAMPARDRAFDAILSWFEELQPAREVFQTVSAASGNPADMIADLMMLTMRSAPLIVESAGLPDTGLRGLLVTKGVGLLLADTMAVWAGDGPELGKTMAHLDRRLRTLEEWSENLQRLQNEIARARDDEDPEPDAGERASA